MKATLSDRAFDDPAWVFERKLDGIRAVVRRERGAVTLTSRTGKSLTNAYPELVEALEEEPATSFVADGEIAFGEWTRDGKLLHPRYLGLREDKPAAEVVRERPAA